MNRFVWKIHKVWNACLIPSVPKVVTFLWDRMGNVHELLFWKFEWMFHCCYCWSRAACKDGRHENFSKVNQKRLDGPLVVAMKTFLIYVSVWDFLMGLIWVIFLKEVWSSLRGNQILTLQGQFSFLSPHISAFYQRVKVIQHKYKQMTADTTWSAEPCGSGCMLDPEIHYKMTPVGVLYAESFRL